MGFEQHSTNPMNSARRKLLRGSVSVPTIMTLSSGAALANSSTIRCFNNATALPDPNMVAVKGLKRYKNSGGTVFYVKRTELSTLASTDGFAINSTFVTQGGSSTYIRLQDGVGVSDASIVEDVGKFVGLRFTYSPPPVASGQRFLVKGLYTTGQSGGTGNPMYGSCWTSCAGIK